MPGFYNDLPFEQMRPLAGTICQRFIKHKHLGSYRVLRRSLFLQGPLKADGIQELHLFVRQRTHPVQCPLPFDRPSASEPELDKNHFSSCKFLIHEVLSQSSSDSLLMMNYTIDEEI
jgi:hypothetical protein